MHIIYLHGLNSSPKSKKAQMLAEFFAQQPIKIKYDVPILSYDPVENIKTCEKIITTNTQLILGSSMGGYYAAYLANKYQLKAALINPVVSIEEIAPHLKGHHKNPYTHEQQFIDQSLIDQYRALSVNTLHQPGKFLLLVQLADEVLDAHRAINKYKNSPSIIQPKGSHAYDDFDRVLPALLAFAKNH